MKKILYIHGFASIGDCDKAKLLKQEFGDVISPDLPTKPKDAIELLKKIVIENDYQIFPIGTSLGGYYSWYLCQYFEISGIQINPLVKVEDFKNKIGEHQNIYTNEKFTITEDDVDYLINSKSKTVDVNNALLHLFISDNDEVLNSSLAVNEYRFSDIQHFNDNHRFMKFEETIPLIRKIYNDSITIK